MPTAFTPHNNYSFNDASMTLQRPFNNASTTLQRPFNDASTTLQRHFNDNNHHHHHHHHNNNNNSNNNSSNSGGATDLRTPMTCTVLLFFLSLSRNQNEQNASVIQ